MRGPIPIDWLNRAAEVKGKRALRTALFLACERGLQKRNTVVASNVGAARFELDPSAKSRGLADLEAAGLIEVERHGGRSPRVTLVGYTVGKEARGTRP